jgi:transketolase
MRAKLMELILDHAASDENVLFLTGDLGFSFVEPLQSALGSRFINAGVSEANMITMASALAGCGFRPYAYTIAPFITTRCYEQIRNDICFHRRAVLLVGVGSGLSYGSLGPSHHSLEDAAIMATLPFVAIASPANEAELALVHRLFSNSDRPVYFRIPREIGTAYSIPDIKDVTEAAFIARDGGEVALVASGPSVNECLAAADRLAAKGRSAAVISVPVLSPFPSRALAQCIGLRPIVTVFEGYTGHPLEIGLLRMLAAHGGGPAAHVAVPLTLPTKCGSTEHLRAELGIDTNAIVRAADSLLDSKAHTVAKYASRRLASS